MPNAANRVVKHSVVAAMDILEMHLYDATANHVTMIHVDQTPTASLGTTPPYVLARQVMPVIHSTPDAVVKLSLVQQVHAAQMLNVLPTEEQQYASVLGGTLEILTPTVDLTLAPLGHVQTTQFVRIQGMPRCANVLLSIQEIPT